MFRDFVVNPFLSEKRDRDHGRKSIVRGRITCVTYTGGAPVGRDGKSLVEGFRKPRNPSTGRTGLYVKEGNLSKKIMGILTEKSFKVVVSWKHLKR